MKLDMFSHKLEWKGVNSVYNSALDEWRGVWRSVLNAEIISERCLSEVSELTKRWIIDFTVLEMKKWSQSTNYNSVISFNSTQHNTRLTSLHKSDKEGNSLSAVNATFWISISSWSAAKSEIIIVNFKCSKCVPEPYIQTPNVCRVLQNCKSTTTTTATIEQ
jgi:hypothetical protein